MTSGRRTAMVLLALLSSLWTSPSVGGVSAHLVPTLDQVNVGTEFDVDVVVEAGEAFNGFDLVVAYDPQRLVYLGQPRAGRAGELMTDACGGSPFHVFDLAPDSTRFDVSFVLLCSGIEVAGPGRIYTVRFRAREIEGIVPIGFGPGTRFFAAGIVIGPLVLADTAVKVVAPLAVPEGLDLPDLSDVVAPLGVAPNPFNPRATLRFELPDAGPVRLRIYDMRGRLVRTIVEGERPAGPFEAVWRGRDDLGRNRPGGVYLAELVFRAGERPRRATAKLVLLP